jgi:hypothetical protein
LRIVGNADATGLGDALKARGDVDTVAEDIVVVDDDVTDVNADAEFDPPLLRRVAIMLRHAVLDRHRAARGVDRAGEFDQQAVAGGFDDATTMFEYGGIDQVFPDGLELGQRAFFVAAIRRL